MIKETSGIRKADVINRRMFIIGAAKVIIFTGIIARLFSLQINDNTKYLTLSDKNRIREWKLPPTRGNIVDYFGNVIAGNLKVYQLHIIPEQVESFNYLLSRLKVLLELSDKKISNILKNKKQLKPWESIIVSENLSWSEFVKVNNYLYDLVKCYNTFYQNLSILGIKDKNLKSFRIALSQKVAEVVSNASGLLGIEVPDSM